MDGEVEQQATSGQSSQGTKTALIWPSPPEPSLKGLACLNLLAETLLKSSSTKVTLSKRKMAATSMTSMSALSLLHKSPRTPSPKKLSQFQKKKKLWKSLRHALNTLFSKLALVHRLRASPTDF